MSTAFKFLSLEHVTREAVLALRDAPQVLYGCGIESVDEMLGGGIAKGEVCIVGARPSHGKTMLGLQWAYHAAATGSPCLIISEEMAAPMLGVRTMAHATEVAEHQRTERNEEVLDDVGAFFKGRRPILIPDRRCGSVDQAAQAITEARNHHGIRFAVVDYLQLLKGRGQGRYEQVSDTSQTLKAAAVDNDVALVVLAQLSRQVEERGEFLPKLNDLRDSGQIEQDADCVLFLAWPWKVDTKQPPHEYRIYGAKNRNRGIRGTGVAKLHFDPKRLMLRDPEAIERSQAASNYEPAFAQYNEEF